MFLDYPNDILTVVRKDGKKIVYSDFEGNGNVDTVTIDDVEYTDDIIGRPVLEEAQTQFKDYEIRIIKYKQEQGLTGLTNE